MPALRTNAARKQRYKGSSNLAYTALPDPTTHIRLLNIKRGKLADGIICSLSTFSLLEAPLYAAISYTWGESVLTHIQSPSMDHRSRSVRTVILRCGKFENSSAGLTRDLDISGLTLFASIKTISPRRVAKSNLWDASLSRLIVFFASLGMRTDDIEDLLRHYKLVPAEIPGCIRHTSLFDAHNHDSEQFMDSLAKLSKRAYFSRVWIIQELHLASDILFLCGTHVLDWRDLLNLDSFAQRFAEQQRNSEKDEGSEDYEAVEDSPLKILRFGREPKYRPDERIDLGTIIRNFHGWQCVDPRDHIYGFLSLIPASLRSRIVPDYTKSSFVLATEYLDHLHEPYGLSDTSSFAEDLLITLRLHSRHPDVYKGVDLRRRAAQEISQNEIQQRAIVPPKFENTTLNRALMLYSRTQGNKYHTWAMLLNKSLRLRETSNGLLTCSLKFAKDCDEERDYNYKSYMLKYAEQQYKKIPDNENKHPDSSPRPRFLACNSQTAGLLCARARTGDYCLPLYSGGYDVERSLQPHLVVRHVRDKAYEIIGQALLSTSFKQRWK